MARDQWHDSCHILMLNRLGGEVGSGNGLTLRERGGTKKAFKKWELHRRPHWTPRRESF